MRSAQLLFGSLFVVATTVGCSFEFSRESAGGMMVVEDSVVDGKAKCELYARNRTIAEVLKMVEPKLSKTLVIEPSVDLDRNVGEIDIQATDWRTVLNDLASALKLTIEESDGKLSLASGG